MPPGWVEREGRGRADDPQHQLLAIFDIFDEWFHSDDFAASVFINVLFEMGPSHPTGQASVHYRAAFSFTALTILTKPSASGASTCWLASCFSAVSQRF